MPQYLAILEVSQKQAYIFGSKRLAENVARSEIIRYVTEELYQACGGTERHLVYAGGGHIILQFDGVTAEDARTEGQALIRQVTRTAYGRFGLEVFAKLMPYDERKTPGDNLDELIRQLERKRACVCPRFMRWIPGWKWKAWSWNTMLYLRGKRLPYSSISILPSSTI